MLCRSWGSWGAGLWDPSSQQSHPCWGSSLSVFPLSSVGVCSTERPAGKKNKRDCLARSGKPAEVMNKASQIATPILTLANKTLAFLAGRVWLAFCFNLYACIMEISLQDSCLYFKSAL